MVSLPPSQEPGLPICQMTWANDLVRQTQQVYTGSEGVSAVETVLAFGSASEAHAAYRDAMAAMGGCQAASRQMQRHQGKPPDAVVTMDADFTASSAWTRVWTGVPTFLTTGGPQTDIELFAQSGASMSFLDCKLPYKTVPISESAAAAVLQAMSSGL